MLTAMKLLDNVIGDMALSQWFMLTMFFVGYECNTRGTTYIKDPAFDNVMCPGDQIEFQRVTKSALSCIWTCDKTPGCITLIYLHDNQTCFGIKLNNTFSTTTPLPGGVFYRQKSTPQVEALSNSQFTCNRVYFGREPWRARFSSTLSWTATDRRRTNQWLQVDFAQQILATHVATKGSFATHSTYWVTSYKVLTSTDCISFSTIKDDMGSDKVFTGNTDGDTVVQHALEPPVPCRCFRINPWTWNDWVDLRLEVLGHLL